MSSYSPEFLKSSSSCQFEKIIFCLLRVLPYLCTCVICYRPQTKLREGNIFTPVCHSVRGEVSGSGSGGGGVPMGLGVHTPWPHPLHTHIPLGHPLDRQTHRQTHTNGTHTPPHYGQQAGGTHPTGMFSCL